MLFTKIESGDYMNIQEADIMAGIMENPDITQRELAKLTGYSIGKVNKSLKSLMSNHYIDEQNNLTQKAIFELQEKKPHNAIILAAGYGMRMVPINVELPKGLLEVNNEPLIERIINQLHDVGITKIDIVVGFMKEQYEYLIDKYNVNLVFCSEYSQKNNLHSLNSVIDNIGNTYIVPCDIWCKTNPFSKQEWYSWYMITDRMQEKNPVRINRKMELVYAKGHELGNVMIGIAYILKKEANLMQKKISEYVKKSQYDNAFWEEAIIENGKMIVSPKKVDDSLVYEINTYEQLRELDSGSNHLQTDVIKLICKVLDCEKEDIRDIRALKKGMTNRSFEFKYNNKRYIMRVPGEGTDKMINRQNEYNVYEKLREKNISDPLIYISSENGYKITEYIENAKICDSTKQEDVRKCMKFLREFHEMNIKVDHNFDIFERIEYYEKLRGNVPSIYRDYEITKKKMYELKEYIDMQPKQISLTHIDAVCDNFLMTDKKVYLIDWEYAGMQDIHVDIAMFAIYALYDRKMVDKLILAYFPEGVDDNVKIKIYCYIAICGFLWSNWCEYKYMCGVEFGEYSLRQYRYAKDYYKIVKEEYHV